MSAHFGTSQPAQGNIMAFAVSMAIPVILFFLIMQRQFIASVMSSGVKGQSAVSEKIRPHFHFAPRAGWMNDPNGMVRADGAYHLFFQHDPNSTLHGPMHWGHARSTDLVTWEELPVALYSTELGTCFLAAPSRPPTAS